MRRSTLRLCAPLAIALTSASPRARAEERVALSPEAAPPWRAARVLEALRDGARDARELLVETTPPGATLDLAYLRDGVQIARARGASPLRAVLPGHARTAPGDRILVRAELAGRAPQELELDARDIAPAVRIALGPLASQLLAVSLLDLGEHARITLTSDRPIYARLAPLERGWRLALADVSASDALLREITEIRGRALARVTASRLGGDLILELQRGPEEVRTPRLTRRTEAIRPVSHLVLEWLPEDGGTAALVAARRALARVPADAALACNAGFERELVDALGRDVLARSLAPSGSFTDAYLALALDWLATLPPSGELELRDGSRIRLDDPVARARAAAEAIEARHVLGAIRILTEALAPPGDAARALRAWLAPELGAEQFALAHARAAGALARCANRS